MTSPRILVLWASTGNGHISVSRALETEMCAHGMEVLSVDALDYGPGGHHTWYGDGYEILVRRWPWLWGFLYRISDDIGFMFHIQTVLDYFFLGGLETLVRRFQPDWVICTHSVPQPRLEQVRARLKNFRVAVVVTDFYPHSMWRRGKPDHFFVPLEWTRQQLDDWLPGCAACTSVTGIPTHARFATVQSRCAARDALLLDQESPTLLLTSGGIGGGPLLAAARALATIPRKCQVVVVCGRNEGAHRTLMAHLAELNAGRTVNLRFDGYVPVETMATLMHASDLLIGKPGGATMAEALASGCPLLIYTPLMIPGQEEFNAELLQREGAGLVARKPEELRTAVTELLEAPQRVEAMRAAARRLARPDAAAEITRIIEQL